MNESKSSQPSKDLSNLRVVSFESRRAADVVRLIESCGGTALCAPSMQEIPLGAESDILAFGQRLMAGDCDVFVLLTGVGTRIVLDSLTSHYSRERVVDALGKAAILCRGPKPLSVLRENGLTPKLVAPEPNTWRELLQSIDESFPVQGKNVFVQEYGSANQPLLDGLAERGAVVNRVTVYRWALPDDTTALQEVLDQIVAGKADCALFTSAHQVHNVLKFATQRGQAEALLHALRTELVVASVGPVTTEALKLQGIAPSVEPSHPKMGPLVIALARNAKRLIDERISP